MSIIACSVDECEKPVHVKKRQLCQSHYNRLHYAGTTDSSAVVPNCMCCGSTNPPAKSKGPAPLYCSPRCQRQAAYARTVSSGKYAAVAAKRRMEIEARPPIAATCGWCSGVFNPLRVDAVFCSTRCSSKRLDADNPKRCTHSDCDRGVRAKGLCSMHWRRKARADGRETNPAWDEARKARSHERRARKLGTQVEDIRAIDIYERDIWLCGLCATPVDPDSQYPDPMSPSLDHVLPLSRGGTHTYENVQLAHLTCNVSKGNRVAA